MTLVLSILFGAGPFVAALIRAVQAGDLRMLWMAIGASVVAAVVLVITKRQAAIVVAAATFVAATLAAGFTRIVLGGQAPAAPGLWAVAGTFGLFFAISATLYGRAR
jgi:hypothetical protein